MKIITEDPNIIIPDIMEDDINYNVLVVYLRARFDHYDHYDYIGHMTRIQNRDHLTGRQLHIYGGRNNIFGSYIILYDDYSSILGLMIHVWKYNSYSHIITMYVLESRQDFSELLKIIDIQNAKVLARINSEVNLKFGIE
jgi:hypothetical protein